MFTVKQIDSDGYESIKQVERVTKFRENITDQLPKDSVVETPDGNIYRDCVCLWHGKELDNVESITKGSVYVMNDQGKTVASYHLTPISV